METKETAAVRIESDLIGSREILQVPYMACRH